MSQQSDRPCGPRYTVKNNAYKKEELVQLAIEKGYSKSKALKLTIGELCKELGISDVEIPKASTQQKCLSLSKEEIIKQFSNELYVKGVSIQRANEMTKRELCSLLFPSQSINFNEKECISYTKNKIREISEEYGIIFPEDSSKSEQCHLLSSGINHLYSNEESKEDWNPDTCSIPLNLDIRLEPHQIKVASYMLNHKSLLAIHRMGSGKTLTAIASISCVLQKYPHLRVVVFCPAGLKKNFSNQLIKYGMPQRIIDKVEIYGFDEYLAFYKRSKTLPDFSNTFVIIDEAHNLRSPIVMDSENKIRKAERAYSIMTAATEAFKVLLLTGSPYVNRVYDLLNMMIMLNSIDPKQKYSMPQFQALVDNRQKWDEAFKCKISYYYPPDSEEFPTKIIEDPVYFTMTDDYYRRYKGIELNNGDQVSLDLIGTTEGKQSFYSKLRRAVNALDGEYSPKVDWIIKKLIDEAIEGRKSLVYSNWKFAGMNLIRKRLDALVSNQGSEISKLAKYAIITGDLDQSVREQYRLAFNKGDIKILLITRAGAEGVDLEEVRNVILMESNWNPSTDNQIIGRAVRYNSHQHLPPSERNVKVWRLMMKKPESSRNDKIKSVDEELYELSYLEKEPEQRRVMLNLEQVSIEVNDCDYYFSKSKSNLIPELKVSKLEKSMIDKNKQMEKIEKAKKPETKYIAPSATGLSRPDEMKETEYKKVAGTENELEMARIEAQMKALSVKDKHVVVKDNFAPEQVQKEMVKEIYNEDEWE